jgi:hypothetical protein
MLKRAIHTILLLTILTVLSLSCGKDTFQSKPQLFFKSVNTTVVPVGAPLEITFRLTDKEGDFYDTVWLKKQTTRCPLSNFADSLKYKVPGDAPRIPNFDGEVVLTLDYYLDGLQPACIRQDTAVFSIWMKDKKGNLSDTIKTPSIIIEKP